MFYTRKNAIIINTSCFVVLTKSAYNFQYSHCSTYFPIYILQYWSTLEWLHLREMSFINISIYAVIKWINLIFIFMTFSCIRIWTFKPEWVVINIQYFVLTIWDGHTSGFQIDFAFEKTRDHRQAVCVVRCVCNGSR